MHANRLICSMLALSAAGVGQCLADQPSPALRIGEWRTTVMPVTPPAGVRTGSVREHALEGIASYYWQGRVTASGEPFDKTALTAAHPTLPFNSLVRVTDRASGSSVVVRINDRGPFMPGRVIDLSEAAAEVIGMTRRGLTPVGLEVLADPASPAARR